MATPTLGYPSRTAAVIALTSQGLTPHAISERIGIAPNAVTGLLSSARRSKFRHEVAKARANSDPTGPATSLSSSHFLEVTFPQTTLRRLRPYASKRGISVSTLIQRIVSEVATDGIVDAVLDDGWVGEA